MSEQASETKVKAEELGPSEKTYNYFSTMEEAVQALPDKLTQAPWYMICQHFENQFVNAGEDFFEYAALQIMSPYAPKLVVSGNEERISLNIIVLANPGSGKTGLIKGAQKIAPYSKTEMIQKQSQNKLQDLVSDNPKGINLMVNDMKTIMGDSSLLKTYETVIADGFISRDVSGNKQKNEDVRAAMIGGAVPDDIDNQIYGGLIFRIVPIQIKYDEDQQKEVMKHITENMSTENESGFTTHDISIYYNVVYDAMMGHYEDTPKIVGYDIEKKHRDEIRHAVERAINDLQIGTMENIAFFRQLQDGFRMMCLHSLLNIHNREIVNKRKVDGEMVGEIKVEEIDAGVAADLVKQLLGTLNGFLNDSNVQDQFSKLDKFDSGSEFSTEATKRKHFDM